MDVPRALYTYYRDKLGITKTSIQAGIAMQLINVQKGYTVYMYI